MLQCSTLSAFLALLPLIARAHVGVIQEGAFGWKSSLDPELSTPLNMGTGGIDKWFFRGLKPDSAGGSISLKPGGTVDLNLGCSRHNGLDNSGQVCGDPSSGSLHLKSDGSSSGCGLSISYKDFSTIKPTDMVLFSVLHDCPRSPRRHTFKVPSNLPSGNATCAFHWVPPPESSADEQYMSGFNCLISGSNSGNISKGKQPLYWAAPGISLPDSRPQYRELTDGAQSLTITGASSSPPTSSPAPASTSLDEKVVKAVNPKLQTTKSRTACKAKSRSKKRHAQRRLQAVDRS